MITLNDRIVFTLPQQTPVLDAGVYKYDLLELAAKETTVTGSTEWVVIFSGNFYYKGSGAKDFDCTDIIRNRKKVVTPYTKYDAQDVVTIGSTVMETIDYIYQRLVKTYKVAVYKDETGETIPIYTDYINVAMAYPYPNLGQLTNPSDVVIGNLYSPGALFDVATQGFRYSQRKMELVPHYPIINTNKYNYIQSYYIRTVTQYMWLRKQSVYGGRYGDNYKVIQDNPQASETQDATSITMRQPLGEFIKGKYGSFASALNDIGNVDIEVYQRLFDYEDENNQVKVAILDICPSRYYLQWQDRLGGFQSQPLKDNVTYSESFSNEQVQSYTNAKRNSTVGVNPKWKLHTGWIEEKLYPLFESIFVTSYLVLYDTLYDKSYNVICTGDWTEKTFKNQKKLLDITFNFEADTKQNIIY